MPEILVVDDSFAVRDAVAAFLHDEGYDVSTCASAEEAMAQVAMSLPDLLILDGRLPGMSGWQYLALLRQDNRTVHVPVLLFTAAIDDLMRAGRSSDPCTTYLGKPFDLDELLAAIRGVIETCDREAVAV